MTTIRPAFKEDAEQIVKVMKDAEASGFMLFDPDERKMTPEAFAKFIEATNRKDKSKLFIAEEGGQVLGYMLVQNETSKRVSHRAYLVIGIHSDSRGKGVGTKLFIHMIDWAKGVDLHRLDLTVIVTNEAAVNLYKKMGFEIEGVKRDSLRIDNEYRDEYYMSKLV